MIFARVLSSGIKLQCASVFLIMYRIWAYSWFLFASNQKQITSVFPLKLGFLAKGKKSKLPLIHFQTNLVS